MIDNDPRKSNRSITRDLGVSEFLIRQVVHEEIRYFSYKLRKSQFLWQAVKDKKKDYDEKLFNKLKHPLQPNIFWSFS